MSALLEFVQVEKTYPGTPPVHALRRTDLAIARGDHLAIMGRSGSGKSTLLNVMGLLDRPSQGTYRIEGRETAAFDDDQLAALRSHYFGFVFQAFHLVGYRTCLENVMLGSLYRQVPRSEGLERALWALDRVGLPDRADSLPSALSGGQRQRVAIARALAVQPSVLLCDEPTGNLDSATSNEILDLIDELRVAGLTVVVITHDQQVAERATRRIWIEDGVVSEDGVISEGAGAR